MPTHFKTIHVKPLCSEFNLYEVRCTSQATFEATDRQVKFVFAAVFMACTLEFNRHICDTKGNITWVLLGYDIWAWIFNHLLNNVFSSSAPPPGKFATYNPDYNPKDSKSIVVLHLSDPSPNVELFHISPSNCVSREFIKPRNISITNKELVSYKKIMEDMTMWLHKATE
ncbi:hypothetical protein AAF712_011571 [Marasmius tenuissimus]|uniref:Uncharacterized protein n=1 Tax=Marasmius tenuissimus TaxID=585030 RepID=A0ABR2ZMG8_9AGAR